MPLVDEMTQFSAVMAGITAGMLCSISLVCSVMALSIIPEGEAFLPWIVLGTTGAGAFASERLEAILEAASVDAEATEAALAQEVRNLTRLTEGCPTAKAMAPMVEDPCGGLIDHIALGLKSTVNSSPRTVELATL
ncbi:hypothetical protein [Kutzneria sp. NPDC051319]|uniref:hypothetical protein n=1 Tax=Kutzneria sp. NPDC051319 TaxID=3155047 RepID=UPI003416500E